MMLGRGNAPARTEADISAALTELAQRAPGADDVLAAVRDARAQGQRASPRAPGLPGLPGRQHTAGLARWLRWPQLAVAAAAATTAVVLAVVLTPGSASVQGHGSVVFPPIGSLPSQPGTMSPGSLPAVVSPGRQPPAVMVAKAMLAAFNATASYLVDWTAADYTKGRPAGTTRFWSWPAEPSPGQVEYTRSFYSYPAVGRGGHKLTEDIGYTAVVPRPSRYGQNSYARDIVVCYADTGPAGCGWARHTTPAGTWWVHTGMLGYVDFAPDPGGADLARRIAAGEWRILGHTQVRGQQAIKLAETRTGDFMPRPVFLWVSTATYLPLRMVWLSGGSGEVDTWYYLPSTKANLAQLRVPIPAGYRRSG
jgi:hypothetical protein